MIDFDLLIVDRGVDRTTARSIDASAELCSQALSRRLSKDQRVPVNLIHYNRDGHQANAAIDAFMCASITHFLTNQAELEQLIEEEIRGPYEEEYETAFDWSMLTDATASFFSRKVFTDDQIRALLEDDYKRWSFDDVRRLFDSQETSSHFSIVVEIEGDMPARLHLYIRDGTVYDSRYE